MRRGHSASPDATLVTAALPVSLRTAISRIGDPGLFFDDDLFGRRDLGSAHCLAAYRTHDLLHL